jgi:hypothetical protein
MHKSTVAEEMGLEKDEKMNFDGRFLTKWYKKFDR